MDNKYFLGTKCVKCGKTFGADEDLLLCPECNNLLDPQYDYEQLKKDWPEFNVKLRPDNIWRFKELLPVCDYGKIVTLGEGGAPFLDCPEIAKELGVARFYVLNDATQPTGSLKDRSIAVTATKAREFGYDILSCDSTGNKAASTAGYAARAGLKSIVFCPKDTPAPKLEQALFFGATLVRVAGHYSIVNSLYREMVASRKYRWYDCGTDNPYRYEGKKTYAYEIILNLDYQCPDYVFQPAAGGMSVVKAWKGFNEFKEMGLVDFLPKMVACQAENCAPIVAAYEKELDFVPGVEKGTTVASAIAVANPGLLGNETLRSIQESGGCGVAINDDDLIMAWKRLGRAGIFCEPSSAVSVAAAYKMSKEGKLSSDSVMVAVVTGSGFKDAATLSKNIHVPEEVVEGHDAFFEKLEEIQRAFDKN